MDLIRLGINNQPSIIERNQMETKENTKENIDDEKLKDACKEFESIFLSMIFKNMKNSIPESGLVDKSFGTEMFEDMYMDELSQEVSKESDLGLAKMLYEQFTRGYVSL